MMSWIRIKSVALIGVLGSFSVIGISQCEGAELGPHAPERELASFELRGGFAVNLFASEPMISNPIHITWDAQGRLWVVCSSAYPHLKPGHKADDTIVILEDTDQDGRADKSTVFADGLYIPTGLALGDGGAYVANQTELLFLKDTDGDDRADVRRTMLSGFGMADSHHSMSAWTWGPGGWLYFQEGTFMHTNIETPHGVVRSVNGGVFQYRPRRQSFRVYADYNASNPWGHDFDRWGQGILVDNPRLFFISPLTANNRTKIDYRHSTRGPTKHCGGQFVSGRHLPASFRGEFWTCQYKSHDIARYRPVEDGAGFTYSARPPILQSDNRNFRPVDLEVGPRGAVYVVDWYDPLIGHMQHSLRDPRRDTTHGRIWRIRHKERPLLRLPELVDVPLKKLLDHLKAPEDWTRYQVKRILYDSHPDEVAAALSEWVSSLNPSEPEFEHHRLEALWCYQTIGVVNEELLREVLKSAEPRARAAAVRVLRYWQEDVSSPFKLLADAVRDDHPRVRMEAVLSASFIPKADSLKVALRALDSKTDRYIEHALKRAVDGLQQQWLPAYRRGRLELDKAEHRQFALANVRSSEVVDAVTGMLISGSVTPSQLDGPMNVIAERVNAKQLEPLMQLLWQQTRGDAWGTEMMPYASLARILTGLAEAAEARGVRPDRARALVNRTARMDDESVRAAWARLVGAWGATGQSGRLRQIVTDDAMTLEARQAAAESLGKLAGDRNIQFLSELRRGQSTWLELLGAVGLAEHDLDEAATHAARIFVGGPPDAPIDTLLEAFLRREGGAGALADALSQSRVNMAVSEKALDYLNRVGAQDERLVRALRAPPSELPLAQRLLREDRDSLIKEIQTEGRPERGRRIFWKTALACTQCHGLAGAGPKLGPDLGTIGSSAPLDYLIESLLRPNNVIKEGYQSVRITTKSGKVYSGVLEGELEDRIRLLDSMRAGETVTIPRAQVAKQSEAPSLMPSGLVNALSRDDFLDLMSYLHHLGGSSDYKSTTEPVLREWEIVGVAGEASEIESNAIEESLQWRPVYTTVTGELPNWLLGGEGNDTILARATIDMSQPGKLELRLNDLKGIEGLWLDGEVRRVTTPYTTSIGVGSHSITLTIDLKKRGSRSLRVIAHKRTD